MYSFTVITLDMYLLFIFASLDILSSRQVAILRNASRCIANYAPHTTTEDRQVCPKRPIHMKRQ